MTVKKLAKIAEESGLSLDELRKAFSIVSRKIKAKLEYENALEITFPVKSHNDTIEMNSYFVNVNSFKKKCIVGKQVSMESDEYEYFVKGLQTPRGTDFFHGTGFCQLDDYFLEDVAPGSAEYFQVWEKYGLTVVMEISLMGEGKIYVDCAGSNKAVNVGYEIKNIKL